MTSKELYSDRRQIIADNIRRFREEAGYKQYMVADLIGTARTNYQRYESGVTEPPATMMYAIAEVLEVDLERLFVTDDEWYNMVFVKQKKKK